MGGAARVPISIDETFTFTEASPYSYSIGSLRAGGLSVEFTAGAAQVSDPTQRVTVVLKIDGQTETMTVQSGNPAKWTYNGTITDNSALLLTATVSGTGATFNGELKINN